MKKRYLLFIFILLFLFNSNVYASGYPSPKLRFSENTTIKYLTDVDKAVVMNKFALSDYDGAVFVTNNPNFSFMVDYSDLAVDYYSEYFDYDELLNYSDLIYPFENYVCASVGGGLEENEVLDVKRIDGELSFGKLYDFEYNYYFCGDSVTRNVNSNYVTYDFKHEGLYVDFLDYEDVYLGKVLIYYVENASNEVLNFSSSSNVTETLITAVTDFTDSAYTDKILLRDTHHSISRYYGLLSDNDRESIMDMTGMDYSDGLMLLVDKDGGTFYFDFNESTIKQNDIVYIGIDYVNLYRSEGSLYIDDIYEENYRYAHGKLVEVNGANATLPIGTSINEGIPIWGIDDVSVDDTVCDENYDCTQVKGTADYILLTIYSLDTDGWRGFNLVYDTQDNREFFNFVEVGELEESFLPGDMNENGKIDLADIIILLKRYLNGDATAREEQIGDMDQDGIIGLKDIIALLKLYLAS